MEAGLYFFDGPCDGMCAVSIAALWGHNVGMVDGCKCEVACLIVVGGQCRGHMLSPLPKHWVMACVCGKREG